MREIKFRAWDKNNGMTDCFCIHSSGLVAYLNQEWLNKACSPIIMQYTGLHDKLGKEIYEGDILERYSDMVPKGSNPLVLSVVEWEEYRWEGIWGFMSGVVIGNIYEHSHLLDK